MKRTDSDLRWLGNTTDIQLAGNDENAKGEPTMRAQSEIEKRIGQLQREQEYWHKLAVEAIEARDWKSMAAHNADRCQERIRTLQWTLGQDTLYPCPY